MRPSQLTNLLQGLLVQSVLKANAVDANNLDHERGLVMAICILHVLKVVRHEAQHGLGFCSRKLCPTMCRATFKSKTVERIRIDAHR